MKTPVWNISYNLWEEIPRYGHNNFSCPVEWVDREHQAIQQMTATKGEGDVLPVSNEGLDRLVLAPFIARILTNRHLRTALSRRCDTAKKRIGLNTLKTRYGCDVTADKALCEQLFGTKYGEFATLTQQEIDDVEAAIAWIEQTNSLTHETITAMVKIIQCTLHTGYMCSDDNLIDTLYQLAKRTVDFLTINNVYLTKMKVDDRECNIWLSHDTVWTVASYQWENTLYGLHSRMKKDRYKIPRSQLISLIILRDEGGDPFGKITKIGYFDPYENTTHILDVTTLHPAVYNDIRKSIRY